MENQGEKQANTLAYRHKLRAKYCGRNYTPSQGVVGGRWQLETGGTRYSFYRKIGEPCECVCVCVCELASVEKTSANALVNG